MIFTDLFENTNQPQAVSEGHADQQRKIIKRNGQPVGEVGIDRESSPGGGQYYMKHYASGLDLGGYDSREEAMDELRYAVKQGVAEGTDVTDYNPKSKGGTRKELIARYHKTKNPKDAEAARKAGATQKELQGVAEASLKQRAKTALRKLDPTIKGRLKDRADDEFDFGLEKDSGDWISGAPASAHMKHATHLGRLAKGEKPFQDKPRSKGVAEAMKPSDIPPSMRDRLTMRDIEAERPQGAFRFRVVTPQGDAIDFMDQAAAEQRARAMGGRVEPIDPQPQGIPGRNRFRVQDPQGSRPAATFQDRAAAERYASAKNLPVEIIPEADAKPGARIERILKMLRARHPQAENDLEALIFDFRSQQSQDRSDIARLDAENDMEEADIRRLEKMLDLIRRRRGAAAAEPAMATESLRDNEYHVATVTLDDGSVKRVRIQSDEGFRDRIARHFEKQGRTVTDIDVDYAARSDIDEAKKKPQPTNPELWSRAKAAAKSKFDVWPSAYASAWAAKYYKSKGGGWRMGKAKKKD